MFIETKNKTRNILILSKNGLRLYELNKDEPKKIKNENLPNILRIFNENKKYKTMNISKTPKIKDIKEKKKKLFLNNILSTEKNYFLKDYIRKKDIELLQDKNKRNNIYRKMYFSEEKIDDCRTSYFNKDISNHNNKKEKVPLMVKDIDTNLLLFKKGQNKKFKNYLKIKLDFDLHENKYYSDFNDRLGVKNVYIKSDIVSNKKRRFFIYNSDNYTPKDFKTFNSTYNQMRKKVLTLIVVGVCSLGLIGCGKRKDLNVEPSTATTGVSQSGLQVELVKFVGEDLSRLNVKRQQAVEIYNEYFKSNTKDADSTDWVTKLTDEALPKYDEYIKELKALNYDNKEVNDLKDKYVRSAELQRDAINQIVMSITKNDDSYVEKAKKDIEDSKAALKEYEDELKALCQQNQITINGNFQMDDFTASPSDAK